jgi:glucosamine-6-phosphate deaminase
MKVDIYQNPKEAATVVAKKISVLIKEKQKNGKNAVLILPTGATPISIYQELIRLHKEEGLSFKNVITFNLDEYYPMQKDSIHSYHRFMHDNLFNHIDIPKSNIHIPDGTLDKDKYAEYCEQYEQQLKDAGGADLALLGIGKTGHIAFNEPGSTIESKTRMVLLDERTRKDAASSFFSLKHVPYYAITMGVSTIMSAKEIILVATGETKAGIVQKAIEQKVDPASCPAVYLRQHSNCTFVVDKPAAQNLASEKAPWLFNPSMKWDFYLAKRAVINLATTVKKGICQLSADDFHGNGLTSLVLEYNNDTDSLCMKVFEDLLQKITLFHDKKSSLIDPEQRVLIFSPHPDDDVICMGAMMHRLKTQGHKVMKAVYCTNGSVAVSDETVRNHLRFAKMSFPEVNTDEVFKFLEYKKTKDYPVVDTEVVQQFKANVRRAEAINAVEVLGLHENDTIFLDLPFYKTGEVTKKPVSQEDVQIIVNLFEKEQPHHIFVAGDLTDPHGTHRKCYFAIRDAVDIYRKNNKGEKPNMTIWLYRGAWQEWDLEDVSVLLPFSKAEMDKKIDSIFKHQSQKDRALFPGSDEREFWQRARDRNMKTAQLLSSLGLPTFFGAEAFVLVD